MQNNVKSKIEDVLLISLEAKKLEHLQCQVKIQNRLHEAYLNSLDIDTSSSTTVSQVQSKPTKKRKRYVSGAKLCQSSGCTTQDKGGGYCAKHGGGKPCGFKGCVTRVAGSKLCTIHGGKRKKTCKVEDCLKDDQGGGFCARHGGGKRCNFIDCSKRSVRKGLCLSHGGGKKCCVEGCSKNSSVDVFCTECYSKNK